MKNYSLFNYLYLFSDHMAKASPQARLLYINMNFHALNGFVANTKQLLDQMCLDRSYLQELIDLEEVLTIPDREEVFITAFFVHNKGADTHSWWNTPYGIYWRGKLWIKKNRIATFKQQKEEKEQLSAKVIDSQDDESWDDLINTIKN